MRNSFALPAVALVITFILAIYTIWLATGTPGPLTELQIGLAAATIAIGIFAVQGVLSVIVEGEELRPGRTPARLTDGLSFAIAVLSIVLLVIAATLAYGIADNWSASSIGWLAGGGSLAISLLLVFYKEAFLGDEASFDDREDGIPW